MSCLILASASPRRAELLRQIGADFQVAPAEIDETPQPGEAAQHYVERLALLQLKYWGNYLRMIFLHQVLYFSLSFH